MIFYLLSSPRETNQKVGFTTAVENMIRRLTKNERYDILIEVKSDVAGL